MANIRALPIWLFIVIGVCSLILIVGVLLLLWRYCCNSGRRNKTFDWLDRLGIPLAKEGSPDLSTLPRSGLQSKYVIKGPVRIEVTGHRNGTFIEDDNNSMDDDIPSIPEDEDPFKRLGQLGIPRAKVERTPSDVQQDNTLRRMKPPPTPLPSVLTDSSSENDLSCNTIPSPPPEDFELLSDSLPSPPPELTDTASDLPSPPPELSITSDTVPSPLTDDNRHYIEADYDE